MVAFQRTYSGKEAPDPELEGREGAITVVQDYAAYFGYRYRVLEGARKIVDTLPKQTLIDRVESAILEPGQAVGVVNTNEGGVIFEPSYRQRLSRRIARMRPAERNLIINMDGTMESLATVPDTDEGRRLLIEQGFGIVPLVFESNHTLGRPALMQDREVFPYDQYVQAQQI